MSEEDSQKMCNMTICSCLFPVWIYDNAKDDEEYFALPVEVIEERGIQIREDLGDLLIDIKRDGRDIKFLAIPFKSIEKYGRKDVEESVPEIEMVDHEIVLSDGSHLVKQFMKVTWQKITREDSEKYHIKEYDIRGHIFSAGCEYSDVIKELEFDDLLGKEKEVLKCTEKDIYVVLHPINEFLEQHIVELKTDTNIS